MINALIILHHNNRQLDQRLLEGDDYKVIAEQLRSWTAIEIAPYWQMEDLAVEWETNDALTSAALYGVALAWAYGKINNEHRNNQS